MIEQAKQTLRRLEARFTPSTRFLIENGHRFAVIRSLWWDDTTQECFEAEIEPYFRMLGLRTGFESIIDAGAATGLFAIPACLRFPTARIYAFEPSIRQRILLGRNLRRNGLETHVEVEPCGLWKSAGNLTFHTHGSMSSLQESSMLPTWVPFKESVPVVSLDDWVASHAVKKIDLIKMDIEGAEIEALDGAQQTLREMRPELLLQAYHIRDGVRTYERCEQRLRELGYGCREVGNGFLHAIHASGNRQRVP